MSGQKEYTEAEVQLIIEGAKAEEREALETLIEHIKNDWVMNSQMKVYTAEYLLSAIRARNSDAA
jgi:hypothetical protein